MKYSKIALLTLFSVIATSVAVPKSEAEALADPEPKANFNTELDPFALGR